MSLLSKEISQRISIQDQLLMLDLPLLVELYHNRDLNWLLQTDQIMKDPNYKVNLNLC